VDRAHVGDQSPQGDGGCLRRSGGEALVPVAGRLPRIAPRSRPWQAGGRPVVSRTDATTIRELRRLGGQRRRRIARTPSTRSSSSSARATSLNQATMSCSTSGTTNPKSTTCAIVTCVCRRRTIDLRRYGSFIDHSRDPPSIFFPRPASKYVNSVRARGSRLRQNGYRRPAFCTAVWTIVAALALRELDGVPIRIERGHRPFPGLGDLAVDCWNAIDRSQHQITRSLAR
jgi:hypothetical protein